MRKKLTWLLALLLLGLALSGGDCIFETKVIELVVTGDTCVDFEEYHETDNWTNPETYDVADELDEILEDNGYSRDDVKAAKLISVTYEVIDPPAHDWQLSGTITIEYNDGPKTIVDYTNVSLDDITGTPAYATLNAAGVAEFQEAVRDYLDGASPVVTFAVENGDVVPDPSGEDPLEFTWRACIKMYIVVVAEYEVPDPF